MNTRNHIENAKNGWLVLVIAVLLLPGNAHAQLRPLEPLDWSAYVTTRAVRASMRIALLSEQRASLAGVRGDLIEVGELRIGYRTGRVVLELAGTPQRFLRNEEVLESPTGDARASTDDRARHDSGDYRIGTAVAVGDVNSGTFGVVRFGTRLPTTDNRVGLDRDATDFFGMVGLHHKVQRISLAGTAGVSINGTRLTTYEQSDVLAYDVSATLGGASFTPWISLVGQNDLRSGRIRGNEDLMELRGGVRYGIDRWFDAAVVVGLTEFSPSIGMMVGAGIQFGTVK